MLDSAEMRGRRSDAMVKLSPGNIEIEAPNPDVQAKYKPEGWDVGININHGPWMPEAAWQRQATGKVRHIIYGV
jgi:hypothetical protein